MGRNNYPWRKVDVREYFSLPRETRRAHLERRVLDTVHRAWRTVPLLAETWNLAGLQPSDIATLGDLARLPTTSINDMRRSIDEEPPYGRHNDVERLADVSLIMTTGGTSGSPRPVLITPQDVGPIADIAARAWATAGVGPGDTAQVTATFSTHGAAWIAQWGLERVGARVVPASSATTTSSVRQLDFIHRFGVTAMYCSATYSRILAAAAHDRGIEPAELGVHKILTAGEVISARVRRAMEETWQAKVYDFYGTMETMVWSSVDCEASREADGQLGSHIWTDAIVIEVLDEEGRPCEPGQFGDLTVTSWLAGTGPKVRYRMGDRVAMVTDPCPCGLDTPRLLPVAGRVDDMIRISGQNIWPSAVEDVLRRCAPEVAEYVVLALSSETRDVLEVQLELPDTYAAVDNLVAIVNREVKAALGVTPRIRPVKIGATAQYTGAGHELKVRRLFDQRRI